MSGQDGRGEVELLEDGALGEPVVSVEEPRLELQSEPVVPAEEPLAETACEALAPRRPLFDRAIGGLVEWWEAALGWAPLALAIAASPGLFLWPLLGGDLAHLLDNKFPAAPRLHGAAWVGGSILLVAIFYLVMAIRGGRPWIPTFRRWNDRLLPMLVLPMVPMLLAPKIESQRPWAVLLFAACAAVIAGVATFRRPLPLDRLPNWIPAGMALLLTAGWALQLSLLAVAQHHGLETHVYDLGIYDSIFWRTAHGDFLATDLVRGGSHISAHVDPLLILLSPLYLLRPQAETIVVLQVIWMAAGAIPVWILARRLLGSWYALGFVAIYLLQPALHGRTLYEFHSLTLAGPLILWALCCLELGWLRRYWIALALLLLTREDMALLGAVIGAYAILGKGHRRLGFATIVLSIAYLAFIKLAVMPQPGLLMDNTSEAYGYSFYYRDLIPEGTSGVTSLLVSLITNPLFVLQHVLQEAKLRFFAIVFLPLLLLPFFAPRGRVLLSYGLIFIFFASRNAVFSPAFQYATVLDPLALALSIVAVAELPRLRFAPWARLDPARARPALTMAMVAASLVLSWKFGALLPSESFRAGFARLVRTPSPETVETYAWVKKTVERIGPDASVSTIGRAGPHVSNRAQVHHFPNGKNSDYLFLDMRAVNGSSKQALERFKKERRFIEVDRKGNFVLFERNRTPKGQGARDAGAKAAPAEARDAGAELAAPVASDAGGGVRDAGGKAAAGEVREAGAKAKLREGKVKRTPFLQAADPQDAPRRLDALPGTAPIAPAAR